MSEQDYIIGYGGKGGGGGGQEDQNTLFSTAKGRVVDLLSEGEIVGLLSTCSDPQYTTQATCEAASKTWEGKKSIFLGGTPLQDASGTDNFEGVSWASRYGTNNQSHIPGFAGTETTTSVGIIVENGSPIVRTFTWNNADAVRIGLWVPALTDGDNDEGDIHGSSVSFKIELSKDNGSNYTEVLNTSISGKTTQRFDKSYRFDLPWTNPEDNFTAITIKVTRTTADATNVKVMNSLYFGSYTVIVDNKLTYPNSALVAMQFNAEQFDSIPTRGYEVKGLKVKVPSNYTAYDPGHCSLGGYRRKDTCEAAEGTWTGTEVGTTLYDGAWDGTFDTEWTCNPAWIFYDLCTEDRYGLGKWLNTAQLDKWALYEIAKYCDAVDNSGNFVGVSSGWGPTSNPNKEARFTCNLYLQSAEEAFKVLNDIAAVFRGLIYWQQGMVTPVQDAPKDPVMNFSAANVLGGEFAYEGSSRKQRHNVAQITWNNPEDLYKQNIEYVEDAEAIALANNQIFSKNIRALGCTSQSQARRIGKWLLYTERYETEICTFKTGMEANAIKPGDIVKIADSGRSGVRYGGRVSRGNVLTEEALPAMDSGYTWGSVPGDTNYPYNARYSDDFQMVTDPHNSNKFLIVWVARDIGTEDQYSQIRVGTIASDNSVSYGTRYRINTSTRGGGTWGRYVHVAFDSDSSNSGEFMLLWREGDESKARIGTISGSTISFGTEQGDFIPNEDYNTYGKAASLIADPHNGKKYLMSYINYDWPATNQESGVARVCTVSGTTITFGTVYEFTAAGTTISNTADRVQIAFDPNNSNKFLVGWIERIPGMSVSNRISMKVGTISGSSISYGTAYIPDTTPQTKENELNIAFNPYGSGDFLFTKNSVYTDMSSSGENSWKADIIGGKITGTSIDFGPPVSFNNDRTYTPLPIAFDPNYSGRFAIPYWAPSDQWNNTGGGIIQGRMGSYTDIVLGEIFQFNSNIDRSWQDERCFGLAFDSENSKLVIAYNTDESSNEWHSPEITVAQLEVRDSSTRTNIKLDAATPITGGTCSNNSYTTKTTCEAASSTWTAGPVYNLSLINTESACVRAGVRQTQSTQEDCLNAHVDNEWKPHVWVETKPLVTRTEISGDVSEITVTSNFDNLPKATTSWILESVDTVEAQDFRILSIRESAPAEYEVSALKYHEAKYALIEDNIEFSAKSTSSLPDPSEAVPIPRSLDVDEELYTDSRNVIRNRATLSWLAPYTVGTSVLYPYTASYYVEWRRTDRVTNWTSLGETTSTSMVIDDAPAGEIEFRVKTKRVY